LSPALAVYVGKAVVAACELPGCEVAMKAVVLEGKMFGSGAARRIAGGDGNCCEALREIDCETGRGDGGTELRSGAMAGGGPGSC